MSPRVRPFLSITIVGAVQLMGLAPRLAHADIPCPDQSSVTVTFATPKDILTIAEDTRLTSLGETFQDLGITIRVCLRNCAALPIVGVPRQEVVLYNSGLCLCPGGNIADSYTDANGCTSFSGTILGGGCVNSLSVYAQGVFLATIPVRINSPDHVPASPCFVDASDMSGLAGHLGNPGAYSICFDYNEDGIIDASEIAYFAYSLHAQCQ